ncbi:MAG: hypothetical protein GQ538_08730, partial [Xanthomonadales bacterium]|nr:hypothetical protein [Xanthomonadales bacterium]
LPPGSMLSGLSPTNRKILADGIFWVVEAALIAGALLDPVYWQWVVWISAFNALVFWVLVGFKPMVFPVQLRIAYLIWVAIGTYAPYMSWMMYVTLVGLGANLLVGWCPLARMIYLLPWNRQVPFSGTLVVKTFFTGPKPGRFSVSMD